MLCGQRCRYGGKRTRAGRAQGEGTQGKEGHLAACAERCQSVVSCGHSLLAQYSRDEKRFGEGWQEVLLIDSPSNQGRRHQAGTRV